jgi:hypothetical protein
MLIGRPIVRVRGRRSCFLPRTEAAAAVPHVRKERRKEFMERRGIMKEEGTRLAPCADLAILPSFPFFRNSAAGALEYLSM